MKQENDNPPKFLRFTLRIFFALFVVLSLQFLLTNCSNSKVSNESQAQAASEIDSTINAIADNSAIAGDTSGNGAINSLIDLEVEGCRCRETIYEYNATHGYTKIKIIYTFKKELNGFYSKQILSLDTTYGY